MMKLAIISFAVLLRILVGFQPHSGQDDYQGPKGKPSPLKYGGDYEAQRHWMEITYHLPLREWYWHSLDYWGLDYPPLTAYVSWVCGCFAHNLGSLHDSYDTIIGNESKILDESVQTDTLIIEDYVCELEDDYDCMKVPSEAEQIDDQRGGGLKAIKELVALHSSRFGYENALGKMYMRFTVLLLDVIIYMSAVVTIVERLCGTKSLTKTSTIDSFLDQQQLWLIITALSQPALLLIDHGHFQYNTTSLGLALWSFYFMTQQSFIGPIIGSLFFSLALNFKQMELYHAPAVFAYLLGRCFDREKNTTNTKLLVLRFCALGMTVILTFAALWLPFAIDTRESSTKFHLDGVFQVLKRLFPFQRGLFEDKVANIWFFLSVKPLSIRSRVSVELLPLAAAGLTLILILPACFILFRVGQRNKSYSSRRTLEFLLWGSASTSISFFLASFQVHEKGILIPLAPLSLLALDSPTFVFWFSIVATWSLWPLLLIDRLCEAYACCLIIFLCINTISRPAQLKGEIACLESNFTTIAVVLSFSAMLCLHLAEWILVPPEHLPDLYPVLWSLLGCGMFCISYVAMISALASKYHALTNSNTRSDSIKKLSTQSGKGWRMLFFFVNFLGFIAAPGEAFLPYSRQKIGAISSNILSAGNESDDFIFPTPNQLERARELLSWEQQSRKDARPVLNLSTIDRLPLADGYSSDVENDSNDNIASTTFNETCDWEDGSVWRDTEKGLVALGILANDNVSDDTSTKLNREFIIDKAPQLLRFPTNQVLESANFFVANFNEMGLLQADPSLLTHTREQLDYGMTYLANMMCRGDREAAIQMIQSQCTLPTSTGLQVFRLGVTGGIEESRISNLLGSAGQSSGKAIKGVVGDMSKDIREWKRVKGGKKSL